MYQISGLSLKNCDRELPDIHTYGQTYIHTYIHTYRGPKQGKPGRNRNSLSGSVLVSIHYWIVKQCWLVNIRGLYRVQVSEKYWFLPQRFNFIESWCSHQLAAHLLQCGAAFIQLKENLEYIFKISKMALNSLIT